ncbi:uncharacterized protein LOC135199862 [Macrobrachium nipponense]|uniref:uncharacterized protein LOC135199862 n=1 Tax=Macrobrachium nipponense TaxID=159736 RepID=UPI0030C85914
MTANNLVVVPGCCCCFSLRVGTLIIAILNLLFHIGEGAYGIYLGVNGVPEGWMDLAIDIIMIIFSIILIHGVRTENRNLAVAWVWASAIGVALSIIVGILYIIFTNSVIAAIILFVLAAVQIYFIIVVRSYAISLEGPELAA